MPRGGGAPGGASSAYSMSKARASMSGGVSATAISAVVDGRRSTSMATHKAVWMAPKATPNANTGGRSAGRWWADSSAAPPAVHKPATKATAMPTATEPVATVAANPRKISSIASTKMPETTVKSRGLASRAAPTARTKRALPSAEAHAADERAAEARRAD
eukprot:scaffold107867_cov23-Tisochrysis_lutea.AAC.1